MTCPTFTWKEILERHPDFPEGEDEDLLWHMGRDPGSLGAHARLAASLGYNLGYQRARQEELDDRGG